MSSRAGATAGERSITRSRSGGSSSARPGTRSHPESTRSSSSPASRSARARTARRVQPSRSCSTRRRRGRSPISAAAPAFSPSPRPGSASRPCSPSISTRWRSSRRGRTPSGTASGSRSSSATRWSTTSPAYPSPWRTSSVRLLEPLLRRQGLPASLIVSGLLAGEDLQRNGATLVRTVERDGWRAELLAP